MLKWLMFSIKCKKTKQKSQVKHYWSQWSSPWAETFHVASSTYWLRHECTPVSEVCYYSTCCFCWPRLTLQSPASHCWHTSLFLHECTADSWGQYKLHNGLTLELAQVFQRNCECSLTNASWHNDNGKCLSYVVLCYMALWNTSLKSGFCGCIYSIKHTVKSVILWNIITIYNNCFLL